MVYTIFMISYYYRGKRGEELQTLDEFRVGTWIHVENPNTEELEHLTEHFGVDEGVLHDALDPHEVPRIDHSDKLTSFFVRVPRNTKNETITSPLLFVMSEKFIMTITGESASVFKGFVSGSLEFHTTQKTQFLLLFLAEINRNYQRFVNQISRGVRKISVSVTKIGDKEIVQFVQFERTLNDFLGALNPMNNAIEEILHEKYFKLYEDDKELMEDLSLSEEQLMRLCVSNLRAIVNVRSAYSTILTNNLNRTIKLLTMITIVLTVPTMIAGLFGMNVRLPVDPTSGSVFWLILAGSVALGIIIFFLIERRR